MKIFVSVVLFVSLFCPFYAFSEEIEIDSEVFSVEPGQNFFIIKAIILASSDTLFSRLQRYPSGTPDPYFLNIGTSIESTTNSRKHHHPHLIISPHLIHYYSSQSLNELAVQSIQCLWSVHGDGSNVILLIQKHRLKICQPHLLFTSLFSL